MSDDSTSYYVSDLHYLAINFVRSTSLSTLSGDNFVQ